jgi:hypothetical protein
VGVISCENAVSVVANAKNSRNNFLIIGSCAAKILGCTVNERLNDMVKRG